MRKHHLAIITLSILFPTSAIRAQVSEVEILPSDPAPSMLFGWNVAADPSRLAVGAPGAVGAGPDITGAAYVFGRNGSDWTQEAKLFALDGLPGDAFGRDIAISGDTVVCGAPFYGYSGPMGVAYVFTFDGLAWAQTSKLFGSDLDTSSAFGYGLDVDGDTLVIGARWHSGAGPDAGAAYVFTRSGPDWFETAKLLPADIEAGDIFGQSVDVDGDTVILGSLRDEAGIGSASVFVFDGNDWIEQAKLIAGDGLPGDEAGISVAIDGDTAIVGAFRASAAGLQSGAAYVYVRDGTTWTEQAKLVPVGLMASDLLGWGVSLWGERAVISAFAHDAAGEQAGAAFEFVRLGSTWHQRATLFSSDILPNDTFGRSVALVGDRLFVGAIFGGENGINSGSTYAIRFALGIPFCFGDGAGAACPCNNDGALGEGCANSTGAGALLTATGSASAGSDDLVAQSVQLLPGQPVLLFAADDALNEGAGIPFGDGLRCTGGTLRRFGIQTADPIGNAQWGPGLGALDGWEAGDTRRLQAWYRDPESGPCGSGFNTSNALSVTLEP